jgi:hypothetical protein
VPPRHCATCMSSTTSSGPPATRPRPGRKTRPLTARGGSAMRRRAPSPRLKTGTAGDGPADTATVVIGLDGSSASWAAFAGPAGKPGGWAAGPAPCSPVQLPGPLRRRYVRPPVSRQQAIRCRIRPPASRPKPGRWHAARGGRPRSHLHPRSRRPRCRAPADRRRSPCRPDRGRRICRGPAPPRRLGRAAPGRPAPGICDRGSAPAM